MGSKSQQHIFFSMTTEKSGYFVFVYHELNLRKSQIAGEKHPSSQPSCRYLPSYSRLKESGQHRCIFSSDSHITLILFLFWLDSSMIMSPHSQENTVISAHIGHNAFPKPTLLKWRDMHSDARIKTIVCSLSGSITLTA